MFHRLEPSALDEPAATISCVLVASAPKKFLPWKELILGVSKILGFYFLLRIWLKKVVEVLFLNCK